MILNKSLHLILFKGLFISKVFHLTLSPRSVTRIVMLVDFRDVLLQGRQAPAANGCGGELGLGKGTWHQSGNFISERAAWNIVGSTDIDFKNPVLNKCQGTLLLLNRSMSSSGHELGTEVSRTCSPCFAKTSSGILSSSARGDMGTNVQHVRRQDLSS